MNASPEPNEWRRVLRTARPAEDPSPIAGETPQERLRRLREILSAALSEQGFTEDSIELVLGSARETAGGNTEREADVLLALWGLYRATR